MVKQALGRDIHVMLCNGKRYPYKSDFGFELILFGTANHARAQVHVQFDKAQNTWLLDKIDVVTRSAHLKLL